VILSPKTVSGHRYWYVITSRRIDNHPREQVHLYLGRLDRLDPLVAEQKRQQIRSLGNPVLALQFDALLVQLGRAGPGAGGRGGGGGGGHHVPPPPTPPPLSFLSSTRPGKLFAL
jgi:hypothetical protein